MPTILDLCPGKIKICSPPGRFPLVKGPCWIWLGDVIRVDRQNGYGILNGKLAHRLSLTLSGEQPHHTQIKPGENLLACHKCDVRRCCNPDHLFWGTDEENQVDILKWVLIKEPVTQRDFEKRAAFKELSKQHKARFHRRYGKRIPEDLWWGYSKKAKVARERAKTIWPRTLVLEKLAELTGASGNEE